MLADAFSGLAHIIIPRRHPALAGNEEQDGEPWRGAQAWRMHKGGDPGGRIYVTIRTGKNQMPISKAVIEAAIVGFEYQKTQIDNQISELRQMLDGDSTAGTAKSDATPRKRKKFSAAARQKMALAQKARWAKIKGTSPAPAATETAKPKRTLSAAGRAAIIAATKKMWARKRAEVAKAKSVATNKTARKKVVVKKAAPAKTA